MSRYNDGLPEDLPLHDAAPASCWSKRTPPRAMVAPGVEVLGLGDDWPAELGARGDEYMRSKLLRRRVAEAIAMAEEVLAAEIVTEDEEPENAYDHGHSMVPGDGIDRPLLGPDYELRGIQERLVYLGLLTGAPSGVLDDETIAALRLFQSEQNLNPSGIPDRRTRAVLGRLIF